MKKNMNNVLDGENRNITVGIRFTKKEMEKIEKIANDLNIPKTRLIRNLALSSLEEAETLNTLGVLKGTKKLLDFKERFFNPEKFPSFAV